MSVITQGLSIFENLNTHITLIDKTIRKMFGFNMVSDMSCSFMGKHLTDSAVVFAIKVIFSHKIMKLAWICEGQTYKYTIKDFSNPSTFQICVSS